MKNAEAILFEFLWKGGPDRVQRKTLKTPYKLGGLDLPLIEGYNTSLKLSWLKRLFTDIGPWRHYLINRHPFFGDEDVFKIFIEANQTWTDFCWWFKPNKNNLFTDVFQI